MSGHLLETIVVIAAYPRTGSSHPVSDAGGPGRRFGMTARDDLPLPDYDHLQVGSLTSRIRTLGQEDLQTLLDYEKGHANRIQVVSAMQNRLAALKDGAQPSGGDPGAASPETADSTVGGSKASEATAGPPVNPPAHGDPSNPSQPR
jgi:hypothetical protein